MKPTTTILIGAPLSGQEARFLRTLYADLEGTETLILAKFDTAKRQIDFVVVTRIYSALLELKNFSLPIFGEQNGTWMYQNAAGARVRHSGENPWQQTKEAKFALSDEMLSFQKRNRDVPPPPGRGYFQQFAAFVCIYPGIHAGSQVTSGDHKVAVASYADVVNTIKSQSFSSAWSLRDWRRFAEEHLKLTEATLDEATNPAVHAAFEKVRSYRNRITTLLGTGLPPLFSSLEDTDYGEGLIGFLTEPKNFLLLGPSGSAKTFHFHHLALKLSANGEEVPLLLESKRYRGGDFWTLLRQGTAPLFPGDPKSLLEAFKLCDLRPVLMIDALNECEGAFLPGLMRGVQSFLVQYGGRAVFTSQAQVDLPGDLQSTVKHLPLPNAFQKRLIYAHHAGLRPSSELDNFCSGFTNAYDLTIAGRCHSAASSPESRVALYDRYVRQFLPQHSATTTALLRMIAYEMASEFSLVWGRDRFETTAERFLAAQQAPLTIIDELRRSRLIDLTDDFFTFEHELLFDYFRGEELRRRFTDIPKLTEELIKPRNHDLLQLVLPRFNDSTDIMTLLNAAQEADILCRVLQGCCGRAAQSVILAQCEALLDAAAEDLPNVHVTCETVAAENGRRRFAGLKLTGTRAWTSYQALLCRVVGLNLDHPVLQVKFLGLLDLAEWSLRAAVHCSAKNARFKPAPIWGEAVRLYGGVLQHGLLQLPCVAILSTMRSALMYPRHYNQGLPIRDQLRERAERAPESHFSLVALFEDLQQDRTVRDVPVVLNLIQKAWDSEIYILRISALELLQSLRREVDETCPEHLPRIREMLETFDVDDIMINTLLFEAMASYGVLEPSVSLENALSQIRSVIRPNAESDPKIIELAKACDLSPGHLLATRAYGYLSNIFEDIYQGVYWEAYDDLSDSEKCDILCLAADVREPGFATDWILRELFKYGGHRALTVYQRFASRMDGDAFSIQERVATFVLALEGYARLADRPPEYRGNDSPEHSAWKVIGEILFWYFRGNRSGDKSENIAELWTRLSGPLALSAADVLYQLRDSRWRLGDRDVIGDLILTYAKELRPVLAACVANRERLPTLFRYGGSRDRRVVQFVISALGHIGDSAALTTLRELANDAEFGKDAIDAIETIQKRALPQGARAV